MDVIYAGNLYDIVLLDEASREEKECNYGIMNKKYGVLESICSAEFMAYELLKELEANLKSSRPGAKLGVIK